MVLPPAPGLQTACPKASVSTLANDLTKQLTEGRVYAIPGHTALQGRTGQEEGAAGEAESNECRCSALLCFQAKAPAYGMESPPPYLASIRRDMPRDLCPL